MLQILNPRSSVFEGGSSSRIGMSTCCMSPKWAFVKAFLACLNGTISLTVHISQQSCVVYFFVGNMVLQSYDGAGHWFLKLAEVADFNQQTNEAGSDEML